jgi:hypothetical protein
MVAEHHILEAIPIFIPSVRRLSSAIYQNIAYEVKCIYFVIFRVTVQYTQTLLPTSFTMFIFIIHCS